VDGGGVRGAPPFTLHPPRLHDGDLLVLCETQGMPRLRGMRTGNRHLWGLDRRDTIG
jgi:hypothetical protein